MLIVFLGVWWIITVVWLIAGTIGGIALLKITSWSQGGKYVIIAVCALLGPFPVLMAIDEYRVYKKERQRS